MNEKLLAAEKSIEFIKDEMTIGLGTGSTVFFLVNKLAELVKDGLQVNCVSTSNQTSELAKSLGIKILNLNEVDKIDLTIDGADEVDAELNGIKGGGGALLFEKIVSASSEKVIWIVDSSKFVKKLGKFPLPVEVISVGSNHLIKIFEQLGYKPKVRKNGIDVFKTDSNNLIIDLHLNEIENSIKLEREIKLIPGVVEVGLFNNIANMVIVGKENSTEIFRRD
ncbi:MAG: ribose-5-phosphate isomerase RpiA [Ignavibacteriales bacterium]|nr:ribose-5-phosphate isomerase RpiA [Ignavibacteriales bacterium]